MRAADASLHLDQAFSLERFGVLMPPAIAAADRVFDIGMHPKAAALFPHSARGVQSQREQLSTSRLMQNGDFR
jgi:hypothetical protein